MSEPVTAEQAPRDGWRHLLVLLLMAAVGFLAQPGPAAAQMQTLITIRARLSAFSFCEIYLFDLASLHQRFHDGILSRLMASLRATPAACQELRLCNGT